MILTSTVLMGEVMSQVQTKGSCFLKGDYINYFSPSIAHLSSSLGRFPSHNCKIVCHVVSCEGVIRRYVNL